MAFTTAAGYGNLPNGNFSPIIYSQKVQQAFRKSSIAETICNSDYFGEIANYGDTVKIIKEPEITVKSYARGTTIQPQDLDDEEFSLTVDKANYFAFKVDDIEEAHLATSRAADRGSATELFEGSLDKKLQPPRKDRLMDFSERLARQAARLAKLRGRELTFDKEMMREAKALAAAEHLGRIGEAGAELGD